ncbi:MAG TPA: divergent polysaccharide deacetylase family protein, partial [Devosia sp.]
LEGADSQAADLADGPSELVPDPATGIIADLVEETEHGPIPRMSATGDRPFDLYARPSITTASADGKPLVAIIVTGLGLNEATSLEAANTLPEAVTLAFAPYGRGLKASTAAARAAGHELMLEVPLEPFDYPDNDPGPDTLRAGQAPRDNMSRLYTVMAKFGGYFGLINNMGARFTASPADFAPMMEELGARGLGYVDDGSSNRSLAQQLSAANRVPFARADLMLDANPTRSAILEQLTLLEDKARTNGSALGVVSALPVSITALAEWSNKLESRGFALVPASAVMK